MVWAWKLWSPYALATVPHGRYYGLGMDAIVMYALGTRTLFWFGHGCSGHRMLLDHRRYYGLGKDALVTVCSWNTDMIMVRAWML